MNLPRTAPVTKQEKAANIIMLGICVSILVVFISFVVLVASNHPMADCTINR